MEFINFGNVTVTCDPNVLNWSPPFEAKEKYVSSISLESDYL